MTIILWKCSPYIVPGGPLISTGGGRSPQVKTSYDKDNYFILQTHVSSIYNRKLSSSKIILLPISFNTLTVNTFSIWTRIFYLQSTQVLVTFFLHCLATGICPILSTRILWREKTSALGFYKLPSAGPELHMFHN